MKFELTFEPIERTTSEDPRSGACVVFEGTVRNLNEGKDVQFLEYEAFDQLARTEGVAIVAEAIERFGVLDACCVHRTGKLNIGDVAIRVEAWSVHRTEAFEACEYIVDEVKRRVPIWKKEHYSDGASEWLNPLEATQSAVQGYYARQVRLAEVGSEGQEKLNNASIAVVGAGGLGSSALLYLSAAGVGRIGVFDSDVVALENLHRQTLYGVRDVGKLKSDAAKARLTALNPFIQIDANSNRVTSSNVGNLLSSYPLVLDCTDNFPSKFLLNDYAVKSGKTLIQSSIYQFEGQVHVQQGHNSGCLRCIWHDEPAEGCVGSCAEVGVLGVTPGFFGIIQATEALKLVLGIGEPLVSDMLLIDLHSYGVQRVKRNLDPNCPLLRNQPTEVPIELSEDELEILGKYVLIDIREREEIAAAPIPNAEWIPMGALGLHAESLRSRGNLVLVCEHGVRSLRSARALRGAGLDKVYSLAGGRVAMRNFRN